MPRARKYRSPFKSFKPFNPPDLVRGPFKTLHAYASSTVLLSSSSSTAALRSKVSTPKEGHLIVKPLSDLFQEYHDRV
jgi:hypothetical protein